MTALSSSAPARFSGQSAPSISTVSAPTALYRDVSLGHLTGTPVGGRPARRRIVPLVNAEADPVNRVAMLGLAVLTVPAVAYSLTQLWTLMSGETLTQAIRAFVP